MNTFLEVVRKNIPSPLRMYDQWVCWEHETNQQGENIKNYKHAIRESSASLKSPVTWVDFKTCMKFHYNFDGAGFVTTHNDPFIFWIFDDCRDPSNGEINPDIMNLVNQLNSYTELSPTGTGLKTIVVGKVIKYGRRNDYQHIECYDSKQFIPLTGNHLEETPKRIKERFSITDTLHRNIFFNQIERECENSLERKYYLPHGPRPDLFKSNSLI